MTMKAVIGLIRAAALAAALTLAGGAIPFVGVGFMLFAPAPMLGYAVGRPGTLWRAAAAVLLSTALVAAAAGPSQATAYVLSLGLATMIICYMLERRQPFEWIVLVTTAAIAISGALALLWLNGSPAALADSVRRTLSAALTRSEGFYQVFGLGLSAEDTDARARLLDLTARLAPAFAIISIGVVVLVNLGLFWRWLGKERLGYPLFSGLIRWQAPEWLIWLLLAAGFGLFAPIAPLRSFAMDAFLCVAAVYFCQGLAIMAFYFQRLTMPMAARGIIYLIAVVQPVLAALVSAIGIFDLWIDFRRLKPPSQEAGSYGDFF